MTTCEKKIVLLLIEVFERLLNPQNYGHLVTGGHLLFKMLILKPVRSDYVRCSVLQTSQIVIFVEYIQVIMGHAGVAQINFAHHYIFNSLGNRP